MSTSIYKTLTIPDGSDTSDAFDTKGTAVVGVWAVDGLDGASLTIESSDTPTFTEVATIVDSSGTEVTITLADGDLALLDAPAHPGRYVRFVSASSQSTGDATIRALLHEYRS